MDTKTCSRCQQPKNKDCFNKNRHNKDGLQHECRECTRKRASTYKRKNPDKVNAENKKGRQKVRQDVINHYGAVCARCGYDEDLRALSIDHINGGGNKHRSEIKRGSGCEFYRWLRINNYPKGYQVLCMNCQFIKRDENGECKHNGDHKKLPKGQARKAKAK